MAATARCSSARYSPLPALPRWQATACSSANNSPPLRRLVEEIAKPLVPRWPSDSVLLSSNPSGLRRSRPGSARRHSRQGLLPLCEVTSSGLPARWQEGDDREKPPFSGEYLHGVITRILTRGGMYTGIQLSQRLLNLDKNQVPTGETSHWENVGMFLLY